MSEQPLLEAVALEKTYRISGGLFRPARALQALRGVSFRLMRGETLGIVGESGCGKSTLGRCLLRLQPVSGGDILFDGRNITDLPARAMRPIRPRMQMIFQDATAALNPRRRVGDLVAEPLRVHGGWRDAAPAPGAPAAAGMAVDGVPRNAGLGARSWRAAGAAALPDVGTGAVPDRRAITARCEELMALVGLRREHLERYPHEFSGGQRQRINIARALALDPDLVVADEPVSALDVSVQAQVVNLLQDLQERFGLALIFIAHDLAVVRQIASRTAVMYLGRIVEIGPTAEVFARPAHPYTAALLAAVPRVTQPGVLVPLAGEPPSPLDPPEGCAFRLRCPRAMPACASAQPVLREVADGQFTACHFPL